MIVKTIPEHEEDLKRVLEQQSSDVLAGWLQAEDALRQQLSDLDLVEAVAQRLQKGDSTDPDEMQENTSDHPSADTDHT